MKQGNPAWGQPGLHSLPCLQEERKEGRQKGGQRGETTEPLDAVSTVVVDREHIIR